MNATMRQANGRFPTPKGEETMRRATTISGRFTKSPRRAHSSPARACPGNAPVAAAARVPGRVPGPGHVRGGVGQHAGPCSRNQARRSPSSATPRPTRSPWAPAKPGAAPTAPTSPATARSHSPSPASASLPSAPASISPTWARPAAMPSPSTTVARTLTRTASTSP